MGWAIGVEGDMTILQSPKVKSQSRKDPVAQGSVSLSLSFFLHQISNMHTSFRFLYHWMCIFCYCFSIFLSVLEFDAGGGRRVPKDERRMTLLRGVSSLEHHISCFFLQKKFFRTRGHNQDYVSLICYLSQNAQYFIYWILDFLNFNLSDLTGL